MCCKFTNYDDIYQAPSLETQDDSDANDLGTALNWPFLNPVWFSKPRLSAMRRIACKWYVATRGLEARTVSRETPEVQYF